MTEAINPFSYNPFEPQPIMKLHTEKELQCALCGAHQFSHNLLFYKILLCNVCWEFTLQAERYRIEISKIPTEFMAHPVTLISSEFLPSNGNGNGNKSDQVRR